MPVAPASPKITPPRTRGAIPRARLLEALASSDAPVIWISGPPGAGKTTLAAAYAEACRAKVLWYQVDAGDADPASFFYFFRHAAIRGGFGSRASQLPLLPGDGPVDLGGFARRYFRTLYSIPARPALLVLDNFEAANETLTRIAREAFEQVPDGVVVVVASLTDPQPQLARLVANGVIRLFDSDALRFTREECDAVARARLPGVDERIVAELHQRAAGWAAGLALMIEHMRRAGTRGADLEGTQEAVFDYFAGEILDRSPPEDRRALMLTASLPRVTARLAEAMSGHRHPGRLLDALCERHLFVDRRHGGEPSYQYHGLFRAFLRSRARESIPAGERSRAGQRAALLLDIDGEWEDAVAMYLDVADWSGALRLIVQHAPKLYEQGRWRTLLDFMAGLPARIRD